MRTLLQIDSSPMGQTSISRRLTREFTQGWLRTNPQGKVVSRDLTMTDIPVIDATWITANCTPKELRTAQQNDLLALSTQFTTELMEADEYIIGVPMHNWGPAASLKLWVDHIVRFGETLAVTPSGPKGTLDKKRAAFIIAAGRAYGPDSGNASINYVEPWLRTIFGYLGIKDMQFITADGAADVLNGKIDRMVFVAPYIESVHAMFAEAYSPLSGSK